MKKLNYLIVLALLFVGLFSSCKKDTTTLPAPTISFTNGITKDTLAVGASSWTVTGNIASQAGLSTVQYFIGDSLGNESSFLTPITSFSNANSYDFTIPVTNISKQTRIRVQATDANSQITSATYYIYLPGGSVVNPPISYTNVTIGSYNNTTTGSSFASYDGTVYTLANAKANSSYIDFIYYYSSANYSSISAPADLSILNVYFTTASAPSTWTVQNNTLLLKVNGSVTFSTVTSAQINALAPTNLNVQNLAVGDIIAFQTASTSANPNKKGVAQVVSITGTDAGSIVLNVKVAN